MTPLRQRFIQDLQLRNHSLKTIEAYVFHLRRFAAYCNQAPDQLGPDHVHWYFQNFIQSGSEAAHSTSACSGLVFRTMRSCPRERHRC